MSDLPADLVVGCRRAVRVGEAGGPSGICGGAESVGAHVAYAHRLTGGPGRGGGRRSPYLSCADTTDKSTANLRCGIQLASCERARPGDQGPRSVIVWSFSLKDSQYSLSTVGSPCRDKTSVGFAQRLWRCHRQLSFKE
jgi:hypothetical protein